VLNPSRHIDLATAQHRGSRQGIELVLFFVELGARARNDVSGDASFPAETPGSHGVELGLGRSIWHHDEQVIVTGGPGAVLGAASEQPDLQGTHDLDHMTNEPIERRVDCLGRGGHEQR
jgi:hypothetical protein